MTVLIVPIVIGTGMKGLSDRLGKLHYDNCKTAEFIDEEAETGAGIFGDSFHDYFHETDGNFVAAKDENPTLLTNKNC